MINALKKTLLKRVRKNNLNRRILLLEISVSISTGLLCSVLGLNYLSSIGSLASHDEVTAMNFTRVLFLLSFPAITGFLYFYALDKSTEYIGNFPCRFTGLNKQQIAAWIITRSVIVIFLIFYPWLYMIFFGLLLGVIYISSGIVPGIQEVVTITAYLAGSSVLIFSYPALFLFYLWRNSRKERKSSWFKLREGMTCRDFVHGNHASQNSITQDLRPVTTIQDSRGNELPLDSVLVPGACYQKITLRKKKGSRTVSEKVHQPFTLDAATRWKREEQERRRSHAVIVDEHQGRITCSCGQEYPLLTLHDRCLRCGRKLLETE